MDVDKEVVLDNDKPGAVVVEATLPRLNPVLAVDEAPPKLNPLAVVVVALFKLKDGALTVPVMLKPGVVLVAEVPKLKPVPVVVMDEVVTVEAPRANPICGTIVTINTFFR